MQALANELGSYAVAVTPSGLAFATNRGRARPSTVPRRAATQNKEGASSRRPLGFPRRLPGSVRLVVEAGDPPPSEVREVANDDEALNLGDRPRGFSDKNVGKERKDRTFG